MKNTRFTPENITELAPNEVFVFGSNMNGNHAGGAARVAVEKFGAIMGQAEGQQGQSYAIPTLDKNMDKVSISELEESIHRFSLYAEEHPEQTFYVTKIGCGIAGFAIDDLVAIFKKRTFGSNVILPREFSRQVIKAYKGFNKDMTCRGFQYEEGKEYETDRADLCHSGFHACEDPIDCLSYYNPTDGSVFHKVELAEVSPQREMDTKICGKRIRIGAKIDLGNLIKEGVDFVFSKVDWNTVEKGNYSKAASSGNYSTAASSGNSSTAASSGNSSTAASSGDSSTAASSGDYSTAASSGDYSTAAVDGKECIAAAIGRATKAKASVGSWIVLSEIDDNGHVQDIQATKVDGKKIKGDTWYRLINNKFVEVDE